MNERTNERMAVPNVWPIGQTRAVRCGGSRHCSGDGGESVSTSNSRVRSLRSTLGPTAQATPTKTDHRQPRRRHGAPLEQKNVTGKQKANKRKTRGRRARMAADASLTRDRHERKTKTKKNESKPNKRQRNPRLPTTSERKRTIGEEAEE